MKVFLTGGTGFIGGAVGEALRKRGDDVKALVRSPDKAATLAEIGCELVTGDLADRDALGAAMAGCDALIHGAAVYEVGIPAKARGAMFEANVTGTENVMHAALETGVPRVVYLSTIATYGNTKGQVVDEGAEHDGDYTSYYDETKHLAEQVTRRLIAEDGLPCVIVQPGSVYGPGDTAAVGAMLRQFLDGKLPMKMFPELGLNFVHRDDVVTGTLAALDKGRIGERYVLGGEIGTMGGMIDTAAAVTGKKAPKRTMPTALIKISAPLGPIFGPLMGFPGNFRELISSSHNVTFWARDDKARAELGYSPRPLEQGLRETLMAEGRLPVG